MIKVGQKKSHSFAEQIASQVLGFAISWPINIALLPALGMPCTTVKAFWVTLMFVGISIVRGYIVRRVFNYLHVRTPISSELQIDMASDIIKTDNGEAHVDFNDKGDVCIYSFTAEEPARAGNGTRLLREVIGRYGPMVHVFDPGEDGSPSREFWEAMQRRGLVYAMYDEAERLITPRESV